MGKEIGFKRITFGKFYNKAWKCSWARGECPFTDLYEVLYVALAEMLDDPERARELLYNPSVNIKSSKPIDYVHVWDTFEVDGIDYVFHITVTVDNDTHEQVGSFNAIEIKRTDEHFSYAYDQVGELIIQGDTVGRMQDLSWPVFDLQE